MTHLSSSETLTKVKKALTEKGYKVTKTTTTTSTSKTTIIDKTDVDEKFTDNINADIGKCNAYNTRGSCVKGLPVGPICNPSYTSIIAAIKPNNTKYFYFIADENNKLYYAENYEEHTKIYNYLKENNLYPE